MNYQRLRASIQGHEGLRLKPYKDTVGKLTIGYGRNLDDVGITEDEAASMLEHDIRAAWAALKMLWPEVVLISDARQEVLAEMLFNLGPSLNKFRKMWAAVKGERYQDAADEMLDSKWARQVGQRARTLADRMRNG